MYQFQYKTKLDFEIENYDYSQGVRTYKYIPLDDMFYFDGTS